MSENLRREKRKNPPILCACGEYQLISKNAPCPNHSRCKKRSEFEPKIELLSFEEEAEIFNEFFKRVL
jgi:hypothetical protein